MAREQVGVLFGERRECELVLHSQHLSAAARGPKADLKELDTAVRIALQELPFTPRSVEAGFTVTIPLDGDYDALRRAGAEALVGSVLQERFHLNDFSMLLDGRHSGADFKVEIGIADASELPLRLSRQVGRVHSEPQAVPSLVDADKTKLPDVAIFADVMWRTPFGGADAVTDASALLEWWAERTDTTVALLKALQGRLVSPPIAEEEDDAT